MNQVRDGYPGEQPHHNELSFLVLVKLFSLSSNAETWAFIHAVTNEMLPDHYLLIMLQFIWNWIWREWVEKSIHFPL